MAAFSDALQGGGGRFPVGRSRTRAQIFDAVTQFVRDGIEAECLAPLTQGTAAATLLQQEILSASSAAAGGRPGAKAEEDGVGGTWESAAACEAYVVAILEVQAASCWRSVLISLSNLYILPLLLLRDKERRLALPFTETCLYIPAFLLTKERSG